MNASRPASTITFLIVLVTMLVLPLAHPFGGYALLSFVCAWIAYWGLTLQRIGTIVFLAVLLEAIYGFPVGVLSLSLLMVGGGMSFVRRYISIEPWAQHASWSLASIVTGFGIACLVFVGTLGGSILTNSVLYGARINEVAWGGIVTRDVFAVFLVVTTISLLVIRWTEFPFRRVISYGI